MPRRPIRLLAAALIAAVGVTATLPQSSAGRTAYDPLLHATGGVECQNWLAGDRVVKVGGATMQGRRSGPTAVRWRASVNWSYSGTGDWNRLRLTSWSTRILQPGDFTQFKHRGVRLVSVGPQPVYIKVTYQFQWGRVSSSGGFGGLLASRRLSEDSYWTHFWQPSPFVSGPVSWFPSAHDKRSCFLLED